MEHDEKIRMLKCPKCGNQVFPKIAPAVIVGVTDNDKILLTKYADREYKRYALIAGFTEIGETIEETVAREVFEETGVHIKDITYYKSQPWGYDGNVLMGFFAKLDGDRKITIDEDELSVAEWVNYKDVPDDEEKISLTREMMTYFRKERENESKRRENKCKKIKYQHYYYGDTDAISGTEVAKALGQNPDCVFKTLVTEGKTKNHYVFIVPVEKELDLKKAAKAVGEKSIQMIKSKELLPLTGYIHGGCSPIGMKKLFKTTIDSSVENVEKFCVSGGKIGYQVEITLEDLRKVIPVQTAEITV